MKTQNTECNIQAVIFDLDATLLDTEPNWYLADKKLLAEQGIHLTKEMKRQYIGKSIDDMINDLTAKHPQLSLSAAELRKKKNTYYLEIAKGNTKIFPRMKAFFLAVKSAALPLAIASG
ncbi:MAG: HAD family hydrolase, partial [Spirochaetia bacterium]